MSVLRFRLRPPKEPVKAPFEPAGAAPASVANGPAALQAQVAEALERILDSPEFRNSRQSEKLLRYLVDKSLGGDDQGLRERAVGTEVFGREEGYDTSADPIVRVRVNEIRKRLARYYQQEGAGDRVRLEVPIGSYRVEFHTPTPESPPPAAPPKPKRRPKILWIAGAALVPAAALVLWLAHTPPPLDLFWEPVLRSSKPVVICTVHPVVYFLSREFQEQVRGGATSHFQEQTEAVTLGPGRSFPGSAIVPVRDQYMGIGAAMAIAELKGMFAARGKPARIRSGNDLSFSDLRDSPAVLIGAFSNRWTLDLMRDLRFVFDHERGLPVIRDRLTPENRWSLPNLAPDGRTSEDYAIVSRVFDSRSGQFLVAAAGITQYGSRAAGEFLTSPERMEQAAARLPRGWERKNLQFVLHAQVLGQAPGPPRVLAVHVW